MSLSRGKKAIKKGKRGSLLRGTKRRVSVVGGRKVAALGDGKSPEKRNRE